MNRICTSMIAMRFCAHYFWNLNRVNIRLEMRWVVDQNEASLFEVSDINNIYMVYWQLLGNFVLIKKIQKLKEVHEAECVQAVALLHCFCWGWPPSAFLKKLMTSRFQNSLQKGKVSLFPTYNKITHNQASSLLCKWPLCRSPWKRPWS